MSAHRLPKTPRALRELLESRGLRLTKERGQNFLIDTNVLAAIAADAAARPDELVLEIGPGAGALSEYLLDQAALLVAADIDQGLVAILATELSEQENLLLLEADIMGRHNQINGDIVALLQAILAGQELEDEYPALRIAKPAATPAAGFADLRVIANLPYSITSPVIIALLESRLPIRDLTLLVQREVADKICAKVGEGEWGLLSLLIRLHGDVEMLRKVPRRVFWPVPKVDSALIRITPKAARDLAEIERVKDCVAPIFRYRRKSLSAGLKHAHALESDAIAEILAKAELLASDHVEKLDLASLSRLSLAFRDYQASASAGQGAASK